MTSSNTTTTTTTANANNASSSSSSSSSTSTTTTSTSSSRKRSRDDNDNDNNNNDKNENENDNNSNMSIEIEETMTTTRMNPTTAVTTTATTELLSTANANADADDDDNININTATNINIATNGKEEEETATNKKPLTAANSNSNSNSNSTTTPAVEEVVVTGLRLEAIFHPKFDNERNNINKNKNGSGSGSGGGDDIRRTMLQRLNLNNPESSTGTTTITNANTSSAGGNNSGTTSGVGGSVGSVGDYLEVSLKHSGSLVLWSGSTRYYSKNSSCNEFTRVAEILLRQYFGTTTASTTATTTTAAAISTTISLLYKECSNFIEENRYTIAFEVVTGLLGLGDHGQIPKKDYVVVTAIADRTQERFLSTSQVLEFCQTYKLPHNDIWTFSSSTSAQQLFNLYDSTLKEIGYTNNTVEALTHISDIYIPSPVQHSLYQGTICEGFIVRYVENCNNNNNNNNSGGSSPQQSQRMEKLAQTARDILKEISDISNNKDDTKNNSNNNDTATDPVLTTDLRDVYRSISIPYNVDVGDGNKKSLTAAGTLQRRRTELFSEELKKELMLSSSSKEEQQRYDLRKIEIDKQREENNTTIINNFHLPSLTKSLLEKVQQQQQQDGNDNDNNKETIRIATLLQTLDGIKNNSVTYTWLEKQNKLYCMIHVHNDPTFFKYQKMTQQPNDMTLFRGFCVEIVSSSSSSSKGNIDNEADNDDNHTSCATDITDVTSGTDAAASTVPPLMLKMKLLPYMVRTFICRNLLKVIEQKGSEEFERIASGLLEKWGISNKSQEHWMSFFRGWAMYVLRYNTNNNNNNNSNNDDDNGIPLDLGPLTNFSYLNHLEYYTKLYEDGKFQTTTRMSSTSIATSPEVNTFVCVVSQSTEVALAIANHFANRFNNNSSSDYNEKSINKIKMSVYSLGEATKYNRTKNCVVYANVTDLTKGIKKFICKKVPKHSILVLYGSDPDDITVTLTGTETETETPNATTMTTIDQQEANGSVPSSSTTSSWLDIVSNGERKKLVNMWKPWKKFPCAKCITLSRTVVEFEPKLEDSIAAVITRTATEELEGTVVDEIRAVGRSLIEQEAKKRSKPPTHGGILIFFPGIPGCGKSSLLQPMEVSLQKEMTSRQIEKNDLYDRNVYVKEGDKIGKNFWDVIGNILSDDDDNNPTALVIADKNAPPASWSRVGQTCNDSNSIPLPVLPDSTVLETTTIEGTIQPDGLLLPHLSHFYPFSLKFLTVSLSRVLSRPPGEHSGKLDSGSPVACMVVVQFYSFYRYISSDTIIEKLDGKLESKAKTLKPIELPFLVASIHQEQDLPDELKTLLIEALQLRHGHDKNKKYKVKKDDPQMIDMEARLRQCIELHKETIQAMTVSLEDTQKAFEQQVIDRMNSLSGKTDVTMMDSSTTKGEDIVKSIKLFSLDIDRTVVHDLLQKHNHKSGLLSVFFNSNISSSSSSPPESQSLNFIVNPHVTMAFAGEKNSAQTLISTFRHLQGREVLVTVTGFLWSSTHAAFAISIASSPIGLKSDGVEDCVSIPSCENSFPHITVWCAPETKAFHSNELPDLVQSGKAFRIDFDEPLMTLIGKFSFWNHTNEVISI